MIFCGLVGWGRLGCNFENQCDVPIGTYKGIADGKDCSFGLKTDGSIVHWGSPAVYGFDINDVPAGNDHVAIAFRYMHGLALKSDGSVLGWGAGTQVGEHPQSEKDEYKISNIKMQKGAKPFQLFARY
jgi:hypothetical protein